jgi:hypothetical protein
MHFRAEQLPFIGDCRGLNVVLRGLGEQRLRDLGSAHEGGIEKLHVR